MGHAVQPVGDPLSWHDGSGLADEDEKSSLKRIFGIVLVVQDPATNAHDHRTVPPREGFKSHLIVPLDEPAQQLTVRRVCTVLQKQEPRPYDFFPALSVTMIEKADTLTVTVSDLDQDTVRGALGSMGSTLLDQGKRVITGRARGVGGVFDAAGHVMKGVEELVEDIQDLGLPRRVWKVIDRVGEATEKAYLDEQRQIQERQRQREAAIRAWTHCAWCGHAYGTDEADTTSCPSCGAARGPKPDSLA